MAAEDSKQYNMLDYKNTENFVTSIDNTTQAEAYYTKEIDPQIESFRGTEIVGTIRIPPKIYEKFGNNTNALLCDQENVLCDLNNDTIFNEKIITRNLEGIRDHDGTPMEFNILPKTAIRHNENPATIDSLYDSNLREDVINHTSNTAGTPPSIIFSNNLFNDYNPIDYYYPSMISGHSIVASNPSLIDSLQFGTILRQSHAVIGLHSNYVFQARNQQIYPFLEYKFEFDSAVSDRFYHIKGHGKIGNYNVEIYVQKPTYQKSNAGDFTIIF